MDKEMENILLFYTGNNMHEIKKICNSICKNSYTSDEDEILSIANYTLWRTAESYDKSKNDNFRAYYISCLKNKIYTFLRDKYMLGKRNPDAVLTDKEKEIKIQKLGATFISLDNDANTDLKEKISSQYSLEDEIFKEEYSSKMNCYLEKLSKLQKKILFYLADGYKSNEICDILHISKERYSDCLLAIKKHDNVKILL